MKMNFFGQNTRIKPSSQFAPLFAAGFALLALSGCKASDFMGTVGQYQGILTEK